MDFWINDPRHELASWHTEAVDKASRARSSSTSRYERGRADGLAQALVHIDTYLREEEQQARVEPRPVEEITTHMESIAD